jgi:succinate-acetate transporter protein
LKLLPGDEMGVLVQTLGAVLLAAGLLLLALDGSSVLALANSGGLLVSLAAADFGQDAGLFTAALEAAQGNVEGFVLFYTYGWHMPDHLG